MKQDLTAQVALEMFTYDPTSGELTFARGGRNAVAGRRAGHLNKILGYRSVSALGRNWLEHRVIWLMVHGHWPKMIDHINGVRDDNRLTNLRDVDARVNCENQRVAQSHNKVGLLGVCLCKSTRRYIAQIGVHGKNIKLGRFDTPAEAHAAYLRAKVRLHEGCTIKGLPR